jgi:hypothetical protein
MAPISYARHRFPPDVIRHAIWLYLRFKLSYRDVEELLVERGLDVSCGTVRRWVLKLGHPAHASSASAGTHLACIWKSPPNATTTTPGGIVTATLTASRRVDRVGNDAHLLRPPPVPA